MTESHRIIRRVSLALHSAVSWQEELLKFISSLHSASLKNNPHYPRCVTNKQPGLGFSDLKYKTLNIELHDDKEKYLKALPQTLPRSCCQGGKKVPSDFLFTSADLYIIQPGSGGHSIGYKSAILVSRMRRTFTQADQRPLPA